MTKSEFDPTKEEWRTYRELPNNGWVQDGHFWSIRHSRETEKSITAGTASQHIAQTREVRRLGSATIGSLLDSFR